jgi:hypothetical protein
VDLQPLGEFPLTDPLGDPERNQEPPEPVEVFQFLERAPLQTFVARDLEVARSMQ